MVDNNKATDMNASTTKLDGFLLWANYSSWL